MHKPLPAFDNVFNLPVVTVDIEDVVITVEWAVAGFDLPVVAMVISLVVVAIGGADSGFCLPAVSAGVSLLLVIIGGAAIVLSKPVLDVYFIAVLAALVIALIIRGPRRKIDLQPSANTREVINNTRLTLKNFMTRLSSACSNLISDNLCTNSGCVSVASATQLTAAPPSRLLFACISCMQCPIFAYFHALHATATSSSCVDYGVIRDVACTVGYEMLKHAHRMPVVACALEHGEMERVVCDRLGYAIWRRVMREVFGENDEFEGECDSTAFIR
uniref:Transmembrane protein n=1 Tax=Echinococcus granulosus TaxID=6210 RepID=A0A068W772_ECHGR|nr:hypothetical protein EgrG_000743100 [Echinococcus granulosus]